jgi:hypothetical protein
MNEEKEKNDIITDVIENYTAKGSWHSTKTLKFKVRNESYEGSLVFAGMITGCGLMQVYGMPTYLTSNSNMEILKKQLKDLCVSLKYNGVGAVIATLGQNYYESVYHDKILELGFKQIAEYPNYRHEKNGMYKQRLYIYEIE